MAGYNAANNAPTKLVGPVDNSQAGGQLWWYTSPTDSAATVCGAGYFTDGQDRGMRVGDLVFIYDVTNTIIKTAQVLSLGTGTSRAVTLNATPVTVGGAS